MHHNAITTFITLSDADKLDALIQLAHELTILARDSYEVGTSGLTRPARVRAINELQHRILAHARAIVQHHPAHYPDDVLAEIIWQHDDDPELQRQIRTLFSRIISPQPTP